MHVQKEGLSGSFSSWHNQVAEQAFVFSVEFVDLGSPVDELGLDWIEEVVEALEVAFVFELFARETLPGVTELDLVLIKGSSVGPHACEHEEALVDPFDCVFIVLFSQFLKMLILLFVVVKLMIKSINDASQTLNALHVTDWCDVRFVSKVICE
jgi:hypothetical protein